MVKLIVVLIIMIIALWQLKGLMDGKVQQTGENRDTVVEEQSVDEVRKNYKETFNDQLLIDQKKKRDEQMKKAMEKSQ